MKTLGIKNKKQELLSILKKKAFHRGRVVLSSGKISSYYLDARVVTLTSRGAYLVGELILDLIKNDKIQAIGGPTLGADPIVGAIGVLSYLKKKPINTFIVRKEAKGHGRKKQIEGPDLKKGKEVILIDDVATTGKAIKEAIKVMRELKIPVKKAIVLIDRREGAKEALASVGCKLVALFNPEDFGI
ncbi:MAG: orotate phosphoribosyltransferase [Candidatus Omnitrophota bacterium]